MTGGVGVGWRMNGADEDGKSAEVATRLANDERERAIELINQAVSDGRLGWDEHTERSTQVYAATTRADLLPLLADLGGMRAAGPPQKVVAVGSKILRSET